VGGAMGVPSTWHSATKRTDDEEVAGKTGRDPSSLGGGAVTEAASPKRRILF
jgi:hypothetical protein